MERPQSLGVGHRASRPATRRETQGERGAAATAATRMAGLLFEAGAEPDRAGPAPQWQLSITPQYEREVDTQQYVHDAGGRAARRRSAAATSSAHIDRSTYATEVRLNYTFKPDLNARLLRRAVRGERPLRPVRRAGGGAQPAAAARRPRRDRRSPIRDFNVRSFRSNLVLRWEWRPGSTLYLVWQQDRETDEILRTRASACRHVRLVRRAAATISSPSRRACGSRRGSPVSPSEGAETAETNSRQRSEGQRPSASANVLLSAGPA